MQLLKQDLGAAVCVVTRLTSGDGAAGVSARLPFAGDGFSLANSMVSHRTGTVRFLSLPAVPLAQRN